MKNNVITMFLLGTMICANMTVTAFAQSVKDGSDDPVIYQTVTNESDDKSPVTNVKASIKSEYIVTLPKTITVNKGDNAYTVNVKGDLAGNENIVVIPDTTVSLSSNGKSNIICDIKQEKQSFNYIETGKTSNNKLIGTDASGNISINDLTAGHWLGTFNFNIETNKYIPMSVNLNTDKLSTKLGDTVNLTANVEEGKAPYHYKFKMREKGIEDWTNLTAYNNSNVYSWKVDKTGTYEFAVDIKDSTERVATGNITNENTKDDNKENNCIHIHKYIESITKEQHVQKMV